MAITPGEIKALALAEDDFAHEMRVGAVLHSAPDSIVLHAGTYIDGVTGKPRQFDYRFRMRYEAQSQCLQLAVECKNLQQDSPLVVCGYARRDSEAFHDVIESRIGTFRKGNATMAGLSSVTRRADMVAFPLRNVQIGRAHV